MNLGYCTITAPVSGLIGSIPVYAGDQVNSSTYLTMVSGNAKMYAEFSVSESVLEERMDTTKAAKNESVEEKMEKSLDAFPDVTFLFKSGAEYPIKGRITSVTGTVDRRHRRKGCEERRSTCCAGSHEDGKRDHGASRRDSRPGAGRRWLQS